MPFVRTPAVLRLATAAARPLARGPAAAGRRRPFHATARAPVAVGDRLPDVELMETSPGNKVNLAHELARGKALIVGVPAAFSAYFCSSLPLFKTPPPGRRCGTSADKLCHRPGPACSESHIPGYISS